MLAPLSCLLLALSPSTGGDAGPPPPRAAAPAAADTGAAARSVDAILADAIEATGGEKPWLTHRSMETKTQIEYGKMAMSATRTQIVTSKNKSLAVTTIPNVGVVNEGTNGKVVWSEDPVNGLRILEGAEALQFQMESTWNFERHLKTMFRSVTARRATDDDGRPVDCLEMTPKAGSPMTTCYDATTHLEVSQKGVAATPQGDVPFSSRIKEWRDAGGVKLPALTQMTTGPIDLTARLGEVTFDKPVDDKIFEVPGGKKKHAAGAPAK
jgi:hypothetical protein